MLPVHTQPGPQPMNKHANSMFCRRACAPQDPSPARGKGKKRAAPGDGGAGRGRGRGGGRGGRGAGAGGGDSDSDGERVIGNEYEAAAARMAQDEQWAEMFTMEELQQMAAR